MAIALQAALKNVPDESPHFIDKLSLFTKKILELRSAAKQKSGYGDKFSYVWCKLELKPRWHPF